jgi:prophage maintenance system killer protein
MASVEDIRFLNTSTNCKTISGRIENGHIDMFGNEIADIATIEKIYIYDQSKTVQLYLTASDWTESAGVLTFTTTSTTAFVGVISVELHDATSLNYDMNPINAVNNETAADTTLMETLYTVASCQIDCCIAKLVDAAIECHCKCDKCKEDLLRAEKVFLMLQGATFAAEQESNYDHAVSMYNKANTLCVEVCACGC